MQIHCGRGLTLTNQWVTTASGHKEDIDPTRFFVWLKGIYGRFPIIYAVSAQAKDPERAVRLLGQASEADSTPTTR